MSLSTLLKKFKHRKQDLCPQNKSSNRWPHNKHSTKTRTQTQQLLVGNTSRESLAGCYRLEGHKNKVLLIEYNGRVDDGEKIQKEREDDAPPAYESVVKE